jgi:molybdenum cofactor synthesis domain-containing protein
MTFMVELICLGTELLIGKILNTNAHWLAHNITQLGGQVQRITIAGDQLYEIQSVLQDALNRKPALIITTGGLGPTFDDKTLEAVALVLGVPLTMNSDALQMVRQKYKRYEQIRKEKIELTPARLKMAQLPKASLALPNPVGTAPAVLSILGTSQIVNLPGVPSEMKAIFQVSVMPLITTAVGNLKFFEKNLQIIDIIESALAPLIDQTMTKYPAVYIKSHPQAAEPIPIIELHLSISASAVREAIDTLNAAGIFISQLITENGGVVQHSS